MFETFQFFLQKEEFRLIDELDKTVGELFELTVQTNCWKSQELR